MAYSFHNQNMSTLSNILVIHTALDKGETSNITEFTIPAKGETSNITEFTIPAKGKFIIDGTLDIECNY